MERIMEMDALQKLNRKSRLLLTAVCLLGCFSLVAQPRITYRWERVLMDTAVYNRPSAKVQALYDHYRPLMMARMSRTLGYSQRGLREYAPESPLSNFTGDALLAVSRAFYGEDGVDFSLANFGGIRTDLPQGDITLYDVFSTYPFENTLVLLDMKGSSVRKLFEGFAARHVEVLSGVKIVINKGVLEQALIRGEEIDDNRIYHLATLDFLLGGGDGMSVLQENVGVHESGIGIRDAVITYIGEFTKAGETVDCKTDGRVIVKK